MRKNTIHPDPMSGPGGWEVEIKESGMSEKTITEMALDAGVETGGTENALAILKFAKAYADQELKKPNQFMRDIAKLLGEDGLGFDGLSWTVDDFKEAIEADKRKEAIAFAEWMQSEKYKPFISHNGDTTWQKEGSFERHPLWTPKVYDAYLQSKVSV